MRRLVALLALSLLFAVAGSAFAATPQVGEAAPAFRLQDQNGHWRTPDDFHGGWLVAYFYPKDFTPGCTTEVCTFRDDIANLRKVGASFVGVSLHYAKRATLLIDPQGRIAKVYVDVDPEKNSTQVLGDLASLKAAR